MRILGAQLLRCVGSATLFLVLPAMLFAGGSTPPASRPKPDRSVKVWTNEDVEALGPRFEAVRQTPPPSQQEAALTVKVVSAALRPEQNPQWYAQQLAPLEAELASVSEQASDLRHFRATSTGLPTGLNIVAPCEGITTDNLISQLEARRREILEEIDALAVTAQANGMPPGILVEGRGLVSADTPLTPEQRDKVLVERYQNLSDQLVDTRETIVAMHDDVASQGASLLPPDARWGGNMTTNLLQDLTTQQSSLESEIRATEDQMQSASLGLR